MLRRCTDSSAVYATLPMSSDPCAEVFSELRIPGASGSCFSIILPSIISPSRTQQIKTETQRATAHASWSESRPISREDLDASRIIMCLAIFGAMKLISVVNSIFPAFLIQGPNFWELTPHIHPLSPSLNILSTCLHICGI
jgi:hypothetical protein